jgi:hypothetical protein
LRHQPNPAGSLGIELPSRHDGTGGRAGAAREEEHHHGGFYYRSLWILNRAATITHKNVPWEGNTEVAEYQKLFTLIESEPGEWRATCGLREAGKLHR